VGRLSFDTAAADLKAAFSRFGTIVDAAIITDRGTGRSRGFGFVTFENPADAEEAVKQMNGTELDGRALKVNRAEAR
jgi:cold-inducible RNA-binding protein